MKEQLELLNSVTINFGTGGMAIVNIILAFVMFGVALGLKPKMLKEIFDKPKSIMVGVFLQWVALPAVEFCRSRGLEFYAVNRDYPEEEKEKNQHFTRKLKADLWIDDRNLGGLPDWGTIYEMIHHRLTYEDLMHRYENNDKYSPRKKNYFQRLFR